MATKFRAGLIAIALVLSTISNSFGSTQKLTAREASGHIGELATVCGNVASAKYASTSKGHPTFLNLDEPYPHQIFTVLIWGSDRRAFDSPEITYSGKDICVSGRITTYQGKPEIVAKQPIQIKMAP